jgi:hypothetical protein
MSKEKKLVYRLPKDDPYYLLGTETIDGYKFGWSLDHETSKYRMIVFTPERKMFLHRFHRESVAFDTVDDVREAFKKRFLSNM